MANRKSGPNTSTSQSSSKKNEGEVALKGAQTESPGVSEQPKKGRGRPKGSSNAPPPDLRVVAGTAVGSNSTLTDSEESALFFQHMNAYRRAKEVVDKANSELQNGLQEGQG